MATIRNLQVYITLDAEGAPQSAKAGYLLVDTTITPKTFDVPTPDWSLSAVEFGASVMAAVQASEGNS